MIDQTTMNTLCSRATEVYLLNLLNGHINLNKFLWDMSKVESPLCQCREDEETPQHVVIDCKELSDERKKLDLQDNMNSVIGLVKKSKESPESWKQLLQFIKYIDETKKDQGRKPLKDYSLKLTSGHLTKASIGSIWQPKHRSIVYIEQRSQPVLLILNK